MMRRVLWGIYGFLFLGGLFSGGVSPAMPAAAPLFLMVAGILTFEEHREAWRLLLGAAILGVVFELAGVHTGLPFGHYAYTSTLGPALFGVPLAIAFAWLILIDFVRGLTGSIWLGAILMTAIDLTIDPLAAGPLHYWKWFDGGPYFGIPWLNFAGWLVASVVILAIAPPTQRRTAWAGSTVVAFFAVLALEFRLWLPGAIGCVLAALPLLRRYRPLLRAAR